MKVFGVLLLVVFLAKDLSAQKCIFVTVAGQYSCILSNSNPKGDITAITGRQKASKTNTNVLALEAYPGTKLSKISAVMCTTFPFLQRTTLNKVGLTIIEDSSFSGCGELKHLSLADNMIASISANALAKNKKLEFLDLSNNKLTTLPNTLLNSLVNLLTLSLSENPLDSLPDALLSKTTSLTTFMLTNTQLKSLPAGFLGSNKNLGIIIITNNKLFKLTGNVFAPGSTIKSLAYTGNSPDELSDDVFNNVESIDLLDI